MSKNNPKKPVLPIYAIGMTWLIFSLLFRLSGIFKIIICGILSIVVYNTLNKKSTSGKTETSADTAAQTPPQQKKEEQTQPKEKEEPETVKSTGNSELDAVLLEGRNAVKRIQEINDDIPDFKISAQLKQIEILTASIISQVEKKEDKLKQVKQFMNYYLPTTIKLLEQYVQLQNVGMKGENIEAGMTQIEALLEKVIVAFQKQLDSLFERDVIDITADIQVMEQMMASQGLTAQKDFVVDKEC